MLHLESILVMIFLVSLFLDKTAYTIWIDGFKSPILPLIYYVDLSKSLNNVSELHFP